MQREYEQAGTPELRAASLTDSFSLAQFGGNKREEEVSNKQTTKAREPRGRTALHGLDLQTLRKPTNPYKLCRKSSGTGDFGVTREQSVLREQWDAQCI